MCKGALKRRYDRHIVKTIHILLV
uniref:Uncharacterized protein n=1 Tax=Arundo donax TaxID=35708 RepID=A0A0A8YC30_ARUDO